ncbi:MAG: Gfo/Idh/MocA family oxidoreductase [Deltaproteobacteria bacterium]|nr:Gfo/Idh/MocA family oxidoreductase [Deltaproteobacteria bacterium]
MIKTAVIGCGYLGRFHAEKYAKSDRCELAAVVDVDGERAAALATTVGAIPLTDFRKLLELGVSCASVVSDTSSHFEIASWLLENGIDVLVEKPMTVTTAEGRALIELADSRGRVLQVGHLERFNPAFRAVKSLLTEPRFFEARRITPFTGRAFDVDVIRDLMIHDIDIIAHLVGKPLAKIDAVGTPVLTGSIDVASARLEFEGGAVANVTASRVATQAERSIRIFQPSAYVSLDYGRKKIKLCRLSPEKDERGFPRIEMQELPVEERDALADELDSFLRSVETRQSPEVTGRDGLRAIELAEMIVGAVRLDVAPARSIANF